MIPGCVTIPPDGGAEITYDVEAFLAIASEVDSGLTIIERMAEFVTAWNLEDDMGNVLPIAQGIVEDLPIAIAVRIVTAILDQEGPRIAAAKRN